MVFLKIRGVDVDFPFEPYACQRSYMEKVIQCLQEGTNGVLESPTGTGKTLCLLCATLAWRSAYVAKMQFEGLKQHFTKDEEGQSSTYGQMLANQLGGAAGWGNTEQTAGPFMEIPKIIYASRTHSQLSQAVAELKNTSYSNLKVCILGSREQLCIHPEVQEQTSNSAKVHMCKAKTSSRLCVFHNNLDEKKSEKEFSEAPLDIEDLVKVGRKHKVCPYYMARELKSSADIIFMPYNYLLDPKSRKAHSVDLKNHIIVFDEAHNLEKMCEESSSFDLTAYDLASCVEELDNLHKSVAEIEVLNEKFHTESSTPPDFSATELIKLKSMLLELEKKIDSLPLPANGSGITKPGSFLYELFAELQITFETAPILLEVLDKVVSYATTNTGTSVVFGNKAAGVSKLGDVLKIAFSHDSSAAQPGSNLANVLSNYYKVYVKPEEGFQKKSKANADPWGTTSSKPKKQGRTLSYWCFSPGHAMQDLARHGVHSIILTSGTLSPLESFTAEMHIDFPVHLENPHVIERHQVWLGMVTKGPDGVKLNSSYENRNSTDYINSLGNAIVNFARIVPNGLLVFFPSYPVMNKCLEVWQESGVSNSISQYKTMVVEPRGKTQFVEAMEQFYDKINDPTLNGAAFFAVCRGKVSEGLDFADINGRAVVITGLPFPPRMDPKVVLKMAFLDEGKNAAKGLTGRQWYRQQASRAVNQAIGRVIRHRLDYGAILLCDHRFTYADARAQLPSWVRPYATTYNTFGQAIKDLTSFFKTADRTLPQPAAKNKTKVPVTTASFQPSHSRVTAGVSGASCRNSCQEARRIDSHVPSLRRSPEPRSFDKLKVGYTSHEPGATNQETCVQHRTVRCTEGSGGQEGRRS
ncbi:PREDICTED: regulator of telomere elongation helicase 1-like [Branchiostoma belcheri]|uniref:Regulator of telomere elongation helicase 1 homolog n=1 Tax=Branchiostoma belcheri TaxID=7741 RepID=A0A6P5AFS2_BRABE|nr:PREDICTED: regulator of telomere elongation helicase 1-like [Branchiostoma belcheri]